MNLSHISPVVVSEAAVKLEQFSTSLDNSSSFTNPGLVGVIVERIGQCQDLRLRELKMEHTKLSSVPESILVGAISRLEKLSLHSCSPTASQLRAIFTLLSVSENHKLRALDLSFTDLSSVPAELLVRAMTSGLEEVRLYNTNLTAVQLTDIFTQLSVSKHHKLTSLNFSCKNLNSLPPEILVSVFMSDIKNVDFSSTNSYRSLSQRQRVQLRGSRLHIVNTDLSPMLPSILVEAISRLEELSLYSCSLTASQLTAIFTLLSVSENHKLRTLDLSHNDLSSLPTEMLVTAMMSGLKEVRLSDTNLTADQLTGIYTMVADGKPQSLRRINLRSYDDSSIPSDLLQRVELDQYGDIVVTPRPQLTFDDLE